MQVSSNQRKSLFAYQHPDSLVSEAYRTLKAKVLSLMTRHSLKTILVTSAKSGEGKTTTAVNLAMLLAEEKRRVLLIDADLRKPTLHQLFNTSNTVGLCDVLDHADQIQQAIQQTSITCLSLMAAGERHLARAGRLSSAGLDQAFARFAPLYDVVVLDAPPVLELADTVELSAKCDGVLLVIRKGATRTGDAVKAAGLLDKERLVMLGAVLTEW